MIEDIINSLNSRRHTRLNISLSELVKDASVRGIQLNAPENKDILRAMLYKYGMDVNKNYDIEICEHRNSFGEKVHCQYFLGIERTDSRWKEIKNGLITGRWKV